MGARLYQPTATPDRSLREGLIGASFLCGHADSDLCRGQTLVLQLHSAGAAEISPGSGLLGWKMRLLGVAFQSMQSLAPAARSRDFGTADTLGKVREVLGVAYQRITGAADY